MSRQYKSIMTPSFTEYLWLIVSSHVICSFWYTVCYMFSHFIVMHLTTAVSSTCNAYILVILVLSRGGFDICLWPLSINPFQLSQGHCGDLWWSMMIYSDEMMRCLISKENRWDCVCVPATMTRLQVKDPMDCWQAKAILCAVQLHWCSPVNSLLKDVVPQWFPSPKHDNRVLF